MCKDYLKYSKSLELLKNGEVVFIALPKGKIKKIKLPDGSLAKSIVHQGISYIYDFQSKLPYRERYLRKVAELPEETWTEYIKHVQIPGHNHASISKFVKNNQGFSIVMYYLYENKKPKLISLRSIVSYGR